MANPSADFPVSVHTATDISVFSSAKLGSTSPTHTQVEGKQEQEITAIQSKLGKGTSTPSADTVLKGEAGGSSSWGNISNLKGDTGTKGDTGVSGSSGSKGDTGDKGDTGSTGITGNKGDTGTQGDPKNVAYQLC